MHDKIQLMQEQVARTQQPIQSTSTIGIWWWYKNTLIEFDEPLDYAQQQGRFLTTGMLHKFLFKAVVRQFPELEGHDWAGVPRGRVVFNLDKDRFLILGPAHLVNKADFRAIVCTHFSLSADVDYASDPHYEIDPED